ncbi:hypothetical protein MKX01_035129 [Papaver californicum]|nr:hypothetical protein MKX01_035129 [Papaver californicum]
MTEEKDTCDEIIFDSETASTLVKDLRENFLSGKTKSYEWRVEQLKNICKMIDENEQEILDCLQIDLSKPQLQAFVSEIVSEPLGVILIISAWNYPFSLSLDPVIGAIAARGNGRVGRIVLAAAAKHLTPVVLELGGKSPVVVDSNVDLKVATRRIVAGKWGCSNGQACIAPDYVITTKSFAPKLIDAFKCTLEEFFGENQLGSKDISRIVNSNHFARLEKFLDEDKVAGTIVLGGKRDKTNLKIAPTILLDTPDDSLIMNEEILGPLVPIITVHKVEDSFDIIRSRSKPLAAYLFTNDKKLEKEFVSSISAGGMLINDSTLHLTVHTLPFGGVGESGTGAYHGNKILLATRRESCTVVSKGMHRQGTHHTHLKSKDY